MNQEHFVLRNAPIEAIVKSRQNFLLGLATDPKMPPPVEVPVPVPNEDDDWDDDEPWEDEDYDEGDVVWLERIAR